MASFPNHPQALTTDWLAEALGRPVQAFEVSSLGEGAGIIGQVTRLSLQAPDSGPKSIIAKFPSPAAENRAVANAYDMYGREVRFYQEIAERIPLRTPACHYASLDADSGDFVLLLEDLGAWRVGDQVAGCSLAEARAVVEAMASLHASGWDDQAPDILLHDNPMQRDGMIAGFEAGWPVTQAHFGSLIPAAAASAGERMPAQIGRLKAMCQPPVCLCHADVRLDNIFFGEDEVALVDWQSVCRSAPEQDLAYFVTQSIPTHVRVQEDWPALYHAALTRRGIRYELATCRERFRISALYLLCYAVIIAGTLDLGNARGQALGRTLLGNCLNALTELDAFRLE